MLKRVHSNELEAVTSAALLDELDEVLSRNKFAAILGQSGYSATSIVNDWRETADLVTAPPLDAPICRDPDDDTVLAVAIAGQAEAIISGDTDLLDLKEYRGIPILSATEFLIRLGNAG